MQRFYCHYTRDTLKPGESKPFIFSFRSEKPGMFNEEWELLTEPQLLEPAPILNLSGMAIKADDYVEARRSLNDKFESQLARQASQDIVDEVIGDVRTPANQTHMSVLIDNAKHFETVNEHLGLKHTERTYQAFTDLYDLVVARLNKQVAAADAPPQAAIEKFDGEVEYIEELITRITNPYTREVLQRKYVDLYYEAKKLPVERAQSYPIFSAMVQNYAVDVVEQDEKCRQELGLIENLGFEPIPS